MYVIPWSAFFLPPIFILEHHLKQINRTGAVEELLS
jgi:hypothetical protein